jgi:SagB-type dehydrogenase family enzyme
LNFAQRGETAPLLLGCLADKGMKMPRYRVARSVMINRFDDGYFAMNLMQKSAFSLDPPLFGLLASMVEDAEASELADVLPGYDTEAAQGILDALVDVGAVVEVGSTAANEDALISSKWHWGEAALSFHLTTRDSEFATSAESSAGQLARLADDPPPPLRLPLKDGSAIVELPDPFTDNALTTLMAKRRTVRIPLNVAAPLKAVSDILFAGVGIVGETRNVTGSLPLKTTPSGGARNPYETYLIVRNVDGLAQGVYRYCGLAHALQLVSDEAVPSLGSLIANQDWADGMAAMVVLVAHFERTMWKYRNGNAYKVVLMEAGHIGQNITLAATAHGLTACPTAALSHSRIESLLGISDPLVSPVYALLLGVPGDDPDVVIYNMDGRGNALARTIP